MRIELEIPDKETSDVFEAALAQASLCLNQVTNAESVNRLFIVTPIPVYLRIGYLAESMVLGRRMAQAELSRRIAQARSDAVNARSGKKL